MSRAYPTEERPLLHDPYYHLENGVPVWEEPDG